MVASNILAAQLSTFEQRVIVKFCRYRNSPNDLMTLHLTTKKILQYKDKSSFLSTQSQTNYS